MSGPTSSSVYESLFQASSIDLIVPETSSFDPSPDDDDLSSWWTGVERGVPRDTAYFDEKLVYFVAMTLPDDALFYLPGSPAIDAKEPTSEMLRFLGRVQLTMTASFVPQIDSRRPPVPSKTPTTLSAPPTSATLAPLSHDNSLSTPRANPNDPNLPPVTPNPFPAMSSAEEQYANVEGVVVWEGAVEDQLGPWEEKKAGGSGGELYKGHGWGRRVFKTDGGWEVIWKGEVPVAYVRTPVENPVLALTASVTLREHSSQARAHHRKGLSLDAISIRSGTETIRTDGTDEYGSDEDDDIARMEEIDLLGGLAGDEEVMPASRLPPSLKQDSSIPSGLLPSPMPLSAITPDSAPSVNTPSTASSAPHRERAHLPAAHNIPTLSTTIRKSFRRILILAPGLRVRMRTIFLPQLLPLATKSGEQDLQSERRVVLLVEVENNPEPSDEHGFEIANVAVEVGGKGSKALTKLICQPEGPNEADVFPLRMGSIEQYNLLYAVEITGERTRDDAVEEAVARGLGRGDETRPVSITLIGRPFRRQEEEGEYNYPTGTFHSRWNCTLDLTQFYASQPYTLPRPSHPSSLPQPSTPKRRPPNLQLLPISSGAIVGDKRYSLSSLLSSSKEREKELQAQQKNRAMMPSQVMQNRRVASQARVVSASGSSDYGLLLSLRVLSQTGPAPPTWPATSPLETIQPLKPFSLEVFVHNRTDQVRRFKLSVPPREDGSRWEGRVRDIWERRKKRVDGYWGSDETLLKTALSLYTASAPALIPLEDDVRCGPLLPGASLAARIRFLPLREGVHKVERLRVTGVGDAIDWVMSPVIEVVVGDGVDTFC
ncbi:hypothetical protein B9479_004613 [Cryptococcus floricola]|uniref:Trafficking protein particle complex II-specific subunit 65 IgD3 domain-containing protein n=1 Tax=Cryptococcus floricola TaxID=2591691 RepID=A0A5D3ATC0_9TREE|nr:hypothetical protein B9479_004613 [Cryptococcus floricola]